MIKILDCRRLIIAEALEMEMSTLLLPAQRALQVMSMDCGATETCLASPGCTQVGLPGYTLAVVSRGSAILVHLCMFVLSVSV